MSAGRHKRPDGRLNLVRERAEAKARAAYPTADHIAANPSFSDGTYVEVRHGSLTRVYRYGA